jgi:hypothetical protein
MNRFKIEHVEMDNWNVIDTTTGEVPTLRDVCRLYNSIEDELKRVDEILNEAFDAGYIYE